jgi:hypothetical protein
MAEPDADPERFDRPAQELDDQDDREELRRRYYGLMQELRVLLPGGQILVAFLLTAPFASRFSELDGTERAAFAVAMLSGMLSVTAFITPTAFHRVGGRTSRSSRLQWSLRFTVVGLGLLSLSLLAAFFVVTHFLFDLAAAVALTGVTALAMAGCWLVLPLLERDRHR